MPFYHCFGNVAGTLASSLHGAACVVPCPSFNGKACVEAIESEKCTSIYGTPTMFVDMLDYVRQLKPDMRYLGNVQSSHREQNVVLNFRFNS